MSKIILLVAFILVCAGIAGQWDMEYVKASEKSYCESIKTQQTPDYAEVCQK